MAKTILLKTEDGCLYIENEIPEVLSGVFIHWEISNWTPSKVRKYKRMWIYIVKKLRDKGIQNIYAIAPSEYEEKLIKLFSFRDTGLTFNGYKLMRLM